MRSPAHPLPPGAAPLHRRPGLRLLAAVLFWMALALLWGEALRHAPTSPALVAGTLEPEPPILTHHAAGMPLAGSVGFLQDPSGTLDIDAVRNMRFRHPPAVHRVRMGPGVLWQRFSLEVPLGAVGDDWLLSLRAVGARDVRFHGPFAGDGPALAPPVATGRAQPYATRPLSAEHFVFPFRLAQPGTYTFYLRVAADPVRVDNMAVWPLAGYLVAEQDQRLFDGMCYGILAGMLVYNLALLWTFRERTYAYYLLTCLGALCTLASFNGHIDRYLLPASPQAGGWMLVAAPAVWVVAAVQFGRHFLSLPQRAPRLDLLLQGLVLAVPCAALACLPGGEPAPLVHATTVAIGASTLMLPAAAVVALRGGYAPARLYLAGLAALAVSVLAMFLVGALGLDVERLLPINVVMAGIAVELVVFAMALASRVRLLWQHQHLLHVEAARLEARAEPDSLTGLLNRAGLVRQSADLLAEGRVGALMLLDLDGFKAVNDRCGHETGDVLLVEIAQRLRAAATEGDLVARLGGDEFVLVLPGVQSATGLEATAQQICERIGEPVDCGGAGPQAVGCSIGIACFPHHADDLRGLLRQADRGMYRAKAEGKGRFAFAAPGP